MLLQTDLSTCTLRPWNAEDKVAFVRNANNRNVWRNLTEMFPHPHTAADTVYWLSFSNHAAPSVHLAIEFEGEAASGIGFTAGEGIARHTGQFGHWLGERYWGKGIATAAARTMIAHAPLA
jgi:RimJ/RimL family protein N-acetyltransferase